MLYNIESSEVFDHKEIHSTLGWKITKNRLGEWGWKVNKNTYVTPNKIWLGVVIVNLKKYMEGVSLRNK